MKVQNIGSIQNSFAKYNFKQTETSNNSPMPVQQYSKLPSTKDFLAFTGGYSLNLSDTLHNLDEKAFPPDIRERIEEELKNGNPDNKTLIDIHREKYGKINKLKTLEEIKQEFPEFENVKSDTEVQHVKNSFIDDVKKGKLEWFDPDEDLSVQLLQMYWADGFSLQSLKEFTGGKNILAAMEKLNIPRLNSNYAAVLKLSDKEYNERFTSEMSKRLTGIERKKAERQGGGSTAPRGPMSDEQKQKISEGLLKYYAEHPEKCGEISDRMKQYYEENPEEKELMSEVLITAWGLRDAKSVRKRMSKFMGRDISPEEYAKLSLEGDSKKTGRSLAEFWQRNPWAKTQWSIAMKKAWGIIKDKKAEPERKFYSYCILAKDFQKDALA